MTVAIYGDYTQEQLDAQYSFRVLIPEFQQFLVGWRHETEKVQSWIPCHRNIAYGDAETELLDIYPVERRIPAPVQIFFHGGGWRSMSKDDYGYLAAMFRRRSVVTVVVDYALCPTHTLDELARQCRNSVAWVWNNVAAYGGDRTRIFISGHSAGAQAAGMIALTDWSTYGDLPPNVVKGVTAISGCFDLEPVGLSAPYRPLGWTAEQVARNSPLNLEPPPRIPFIVALGAHETQEMHRQSRRYAEMLQQAGIEYEYHSVAGHNHYSVLDAFENEDHPLGRAVLRQMGVG